MLKKLCLFFLAGLLILTSCNMPLSTARTPRVWFDVPVSGLIVPVNTAVNIEGRAFSIPGTSKVEIRVNDDLLTTIENPPAIEDLAYFQTSWVPSAEGEYILHAVAVSKNGQTSQTDNTRVIVTNSDIKATGTASPTILVSRSPTVTPTPRITNTVRSRPVITFTPRPPVQQDEPEEQAPPPPDTTGPAAPGGLEPAGAKLPCAGSVTLNWHASSDPSGISGYKLEIQRSSNGKSWQPHPTSPTAGAKGNSFNVKVECGWYYRWRVRAIDGKGNQGPLSGLAQFSVLLN